MNKSKKIIAMLLSIAIITTIYIATKTSIASQKNQKAHRVSHKNPDGTYKYTNHLKDQTSPYLRQHAHNPVNWRPWGKDAFDQARKTGKPIFLSIGYSTCYWCHVMERESFENEKIAAQMNKLFVCIKVDREERPDIDAIYMLATQMLTGSGGWPMTVILTPPGAGGKNDPGLKPFWAGTYIPPAPKYGRPGMPQLLSALSQSYQNKKQDVLKMAEKISQVIKQQHQNVAVGGKLSLDTLLKTEKITRKNYDPQYGGYTQKPKFPQVSQLMFILNRAAPKNKKQSWQEITHTLDAMAHGGINDQIAGGFHRYSTDEKWLVPHFEKMLYDQAQLVQLYLKAAQIAKEKGQSPAEYQRIATETCQYVLNEMVDQSGAFWSAQDAEVDAVEGANYVWTKDQIIQVLKDQPDKIKNFALAFYGLNQGTNFIDPHDPNATPVNVLYLPDGIVGYAKKTGMQLQEILTLRKKTNRLLYLARAKRKQPGTDDKILASWNGMMIAAMAKTGRTLNQKKLVLGSQKAMDAILKSMKTKQGGLYRTMRKEKAKIPAFLEDYAHIIHALLEVYLATEDQKYLTQAILFADQVETKFAANKGGYFDVLQNQSDLFVRTRETYDGAVPTGNSAMFNALLDLHKITKEKKYFNLVAKGLNAFANELNNQGPAMMNMLRCLQRANRIDPSALFAENKHPPTKIIQAKKVKLSLNTLTPKWTDNKANLKLTINIDKNWHINAHNPGSEYLVGLNITLLADENYQIKIKYPQGKKIAPAGMDPFFAHEGPLVLDIVLTRKKQNKNDSQIKLETSFQACDQAGTCLQPETIKFILNPKK